MKVIHLLIAVVLLSCSKSNDDDAQNNNKTRTDLLVDKKWQLSAESGKLADGTIIPDQFPDYPAYAKDDYWIFKSNLKYELHDNIEIHPPQVPPIGEVMASGTWALINSDQYLIVKRDSDGYEANVKITDLTETQLKTEGIIEENGNTIYSTYKVVP